MNRRRGSGLGIVGWAIVLGVALLAFFAIVDWKAGDLNDFLNFMRDIWKGTP